MLKGELTSVKPELSNNSVLGYRYPAAEDIMGATTEKAVDDLDLLARMGILNKEVSMFTLACPNCESSLIRTNRTCPECGMQTVNKMKLVECLNCGEVNQGEEKISSCSACNHPFKRVNEDFVRFQGNFCIKCNKVTDDPLMSAQCINCGWVDGYEQLSQLPLYTYHFNVDEKAKLFRLLGSRPLLSKEVLTRERKVFRNRISQRILSMLQKNSRRSYRDIGRRLGVSEATIRARVGKLRKEGVITSFTALLDPTKIGIDHICVMKLRGSPETLKKTRSKLRTMHEIKLVCESNGSLELVVMGYFKGKNHMQRTIDEIGRISGLEIMDVTSGSNVDKMDFKLDIDKYLTSEN